MVRNVGARVTAVVAQREALAAELREAWRRGELRSRDLYEQHLEATCERRGRTIPAGRGQPAWQAAFDLRLKIHRSEGSTMALRPSSDGSSVEVSNRCLVAPWRHVEEGLAALVRRGGQLPNGGEYRVRLTGGRVPHELSYFGYAVNPGGPHAHVLIGCQKITRAELERARDEHRRRFGATEVAGRKRRRGARSVAGVVVRGGSGNFSRQRTSLGDVRPGRGRRREGPEFAVGQRWRFRDGTEWRVREVEPARIGVAVVTLRRGRGRYPETRVVRGSYLRRWWEPVGA